MRQQRGKRVNALPDGRGDLAMMLDSARTIMTPSARSDVPPFMVMDVMAAAARIEAAGGKVIHMEVGQPAVGAPSTAIAAVQAVLGKSALGYTESLGIPSLRARIARHYAETYRAAGECRPRDRDHRLVGRIHPGVSAMFEPGDRVAIANPGYPPYRHILTALGCEPVLIETDAATRFAITGESLRAAHAKKPLAGVLVASPANPTGTMMTPDALAALIRVADDEGIRFISDEIYHGLDYAVPVETAARLSENAVVINSFSKYFCMTGWRIGWMVVPQALGAADRPAARQSRDLGADAVADRGGGGVRGARRARGDQAWLRGQPENPDRRTAQGGPDEIPSGRRRVLSLCRRLRILQRQFRFRQAAAGGGACGGDAGRRFRSDQRPALRPLLLRGLRRRHEGSGRAHRRIGCASADDGGTGALHCVLRRGSARRRPLGAGAVVEHHQDLPFGLRAGAGRRRPARSRPAACPAAASRCGNCCSTPAD